MKRLLLVDGDAGLLSIRRLRFLMEGYEVRETGDCAALAGTLAAFRPDLVILDPPRAGAPAEALLRSIRGDPRFDAVKIVVNSALRFGDESRFCAELGADAYLAKPVEHRVLSDTIRRLLHDEVRIVFWGTRASVARPGVDSLKFGGNTYCVSAELGGDRLFALDAGTGVLELGRALEREERRPRVAVLLSRLQPDRIEGLPWFAPLNEPGFEVTIHGPRRGEAAALRGAPRLRYHPLGEGERGVHGVRVAAIAPEAAPDALGYRLTCESGRRIAYLTGEEFVAEEGAARERLVEFVRGVDMLLLDAGRSDLIEALRLVCEARPGRLYLFHRDPAHDDEAVSRMEATAKCYLEQHHPDIACAAAREGQTVTLEA